MYVSKRKENKGEMSPKPSVLRYLNSDVFKINFVIFNHGHELYMILPS